MSHQDPYGTVKELWNYTIPHWTLSPEGGQQVSKHTPSKSTTLTGPRCTPWNRSIGTFDRHTNITFRRSAHSCLPMRAVSAEATLLLGTSPLALLTVN
jgi:hypothetical protein